MPGGDAALAGQPAGLMAGAAMMQPAMALPEAPYTIVNVAFLIVCTLLLVVVGIMMVDLVDAPAGLRHAALRQQLAAGLGPGLVHEIRRRNELNGPNQEARHSCLAGKDRQNDRQARMPVLLQRDWSTSSVTTPRHGFERSRTMKANGWLAIALVWAACPALSGCFVPQSELAAAQSQNSVLAQQNRANWPKSTTSQAHNHDVENRLIRTEQELAALEEQVEVDRKRLANYKQETTELHDQFKTAAGTRRTAGPAIRVPLLPVQ